jgi:hypothetical protein
MPPENSLSIRSCHRSRSPWVALVALVSAAELLGTGCGAKSLGDSPTGAAHATSDSSVVRNDGGRDGAVDHRADGSSVCDGAVQNDPVAACATPATPEVGYADAAELAALLLGNWIRCEGPIQPIGQAPAPDGQIGLEFDLFPGQSLGGMGALLPPANGPCYGFVLAYVGGNQYDPVSWAFNAGTAGAPGLVLQATTGPAVYDQPAFSAGGNRMSLTDSIWNGTYVKL